MSALTVWRERLRALFQRASEERELAEELRFHQEMETEANLARGHSPAEARRRVAFGGVDRFTEEVRDARGAAPIERLVRDARLAARRLRRDPSFAVPVVVVLAIGIGVTTAVLALVHATLMAPLPYQDADRLVELQHHASKVELPMHGVSPGTVHLYRTGSRALGAIGMYAEDVATLSDLDTPEQIRLASVTPQLLDVLRPSVFTGRWLPSGAFSPDRFNGVLISHALWVRRYGADPGIVGRTIEIERRRASVNGVLPPRFGFPNADTDVWDAISWPERDISYARLYELSYGAVGRLGPGVSIDDAERELNRLMPTFTDAFADVGAQEVEELGLRVSVVSLKAAIIGDLRIPLLLLLGAAAFLLLITWANATNLALVRAERLRREVAVARALGASAADLARRFGCEGALLALAGGALGLALAWAAVTLRFGFAPGALPRLDELRLDGLVLGAAAALTLLSAALLAGVALFAVRRPQVAALLVGGSGRLTSGRREQIGRQVLVTAQVALALTLLVGSALMTQSFWRLSRVPLGFRAEDVLTFSLPIPPLAVARNDASEVPFLYHRVARVDAEVLARLRALPGVLAAEAASVSGFPLTPVGSSYDTRITVADRAAEPAEEWPYAQRSFATPGYFEAMGIPILGGRSFRAEDTGATEHGVILSASLARTLFGPGQPIGGHVRLSSQPKGPAFVVVGVVGDVPSETTRDGRTRMMYLPNVYPPLANTITGTVHFHIPNDEVFVVRTALPASSLLPTIRRIVREVDPKLLVTRVRTLEQLISDDTARTRLTMLLLALAAATALALGVIGIYGVLAYAVAERTPELGIRIALGAEPARVVRAVVRQGALLALAGTAAGLIAALALTRFLRGLLYEVSPNDPLVFASMAALLLVVALVASWVPARRAGRIDPVRALRG